MTVAIFKHPFQGMSGDNDEPLYRPWENGLWETEDDGIGLATLEAVLDTHMEHIQAKKTTQQAKTRDALRKPPQKAVRQREADASVQAAEWETKAHKAVAAYFAVALVAAAAAVYLQTGG